MNGHNITNESLALSMVLVLIAILVSYREKLALEKDIIWSICIFYINYFRWNIITWIIRPTCYSI